MTTIDRPLAKPECPYFSSGPCTKHPGWSLKNLNDAAIGRSHRSKIGKTKLASAIERTRVLLGVPADYRIGIVPASDTGAVEMALWSLLGARGVDVLAWESFGQGWVTDITKQLKLEDVRILKANYGKLPDLGTVDPARDIIFTWNGTTSGVRVPNGDWIKDDRQGLTICDAILGPRAVERLETYTPPWPLPKIFRLTKGGKLIEGIFSGATINTPSMLCVEDYLDALAWAEGSGGLDALFSRANTNLEVIADWVERTLWIEFLAECKLTRSNTSVCLKIVDPRITSLSNEAQAAFVKSLSSKLEAEDVAYDIGAYRDAPPGLRIWTGATVEAANVKALLPWLDWAFSVCSSELAEAA